MKCQNKRDSLTSAQIRVFSPSTKEPHALCVEYSLGEKEIVQEREGLFVQVRQCDQTTRLCFQYLAIFSNENLPKNIQIVQN